MSLSAPIGDVGEGGRGLFIQWVVGLRREQKNVLQRIPQFFPTLRVYMSSEMFTQDTLLWDTPSMDSLTLIVLTHLLLRREWIGNKRREKVECYPATMPKGLNSAHHFW